MENNNNVLEIRGLNSYFFTEKGVAPAVLPSAGPVSVLCVSLSFAKSLLPYKH